jgi:uncharacterized protein (DUF983 family)
MSDHTHPGAEPVSFNTAVWRGLRGHCPRCGEGRIFRAFLKVADHCPDCGEALHHHRADDLPAYLVMVVVGHVVVGLLLWAENVYHPSFLTHALLWVPLALGLSLAMLQPVKGAVVALQWHAGMHGFAGGRMLRQSASAVPVDVLQRPAGNPGSR